MTGFDVTQVTTLSEEILSLIVWASAIGGSGLAVLVMTKWWGRRQQGDEVAKAVSAARRKAARSAGASAPLR